MNIQNKGPPGTPAAYSQIRPDKENKIVTPEMGYFCFETLFHKLTKQTQMGNILENPPFRNDSYPIFVTWKINETGALRGCIGTFLSLPLHDGLRKYALQSAFDDNRFKPIGLEELKTLNNSVSLLHDFEECRDYLDWEIGKHGIQIVLDMADVYGNGTSANKLCATFLPEVAWDQGFTKEQTLVALLKKSGFNGQITDQLKKKVKVTRYQSDKLTVSYQDYINHCQPKLKSETEVAMVQKK